MVERKTARTQASDVQKFWLKLDTKVAALAKKKGHDAIAYTDPAPPALREIVLLSPGGVKGKIS